MSDTIKNYGANTGKNRPRPLGVAHARHAIEHRPAHPTGRDGVSPQKAGGGHLGQHGGKKGRTK
jgi:hypothetical protein